MSDYDNLTDEQIMERVRAAKTALNDAGMADRDPGIEIAAFMDIFHPGDPRTDELVRAARRVGREDTGR